MKGGGGLRRRCFFSTRATRMRPPSISLISAFAEAPSSSPAVATATGSRALPPTSSATCFTIDWASVSRAMLNWVSLFPP